MCLLYFETSNYSIWDGVQELERGLPFTFVSELVVWFASATSDYGIEGIHYICKYFERTIE